MIVGLTGRRHVGKSEIARILERRGFLRVHPLDGGKIATKAYFIHLGASEDEADRMVHGDLKDAPSPYLPGNATARYFMEKFGRFMGETLGNEWTLGAELDLQPDGADIVAESVVYEEKTVRRRGGKIIRVSRPGHVGPDGIESDEAQAAIAADYELVNDGGKADLETKIDEALRALI